MWDKFPHSVALDLGSGDLGANYRLVAEIARSIAPLMRSKAIVVSDPPCDQPGWNALPLPSGIRAGRYHLYLVD
jgi:hypothetical protein